MSFVKYLESVIPLVPWVLTGLKSPWDQHCGKQANFGGETRVLVKPSDYWHLSRNSVSNIEARTINVLCRSKVICLKFALKNV